MSIYDNLGVKTFATYNTYFEEETEETKETLSEGLSPATILTAINELKAWNHTINDLEYQYEKLKMEYEHDMIRTTNSRDYQENIRQLNFENKKQHYYTQTNRKN